MLKKQLSNFPFLKPFCFDVKTILSNNDKTRLSVNHPIEKTCLKDCPFFAIDKNGKIPCYGQNGRFCFQNVIDANNNRYNLFLNNSELYFKMYRKELSAKRKNPLSHIRINGIGDTPNMKYAIKQNEIIKEFKHIKFWIASRKTMIYDNIILPDNAIVRYSTGINGLYTSDISDNIKDVTCPCNTKDKVKNCSVCGYHCWNKDIKNITYELKK